MARELATIQRIRELNPIPNADTIEVASILGWKVVVRKGEFQVGDLVVYCEIDSILPDKPEFEFLKPRKFRIRTVRLRGQISQGIAFPLSILPQNKSESSSTETVDRLTTNLVQTGFEEGLDVTELLDIEKYMPAIPTYLAGTVKGTFPSFVPKTDETRVQLLQTLLTRYKGTKCYVSEKVDGCSVTYYFKNEFGVCSRNLELKETEENLLWKQAKLNNIESLLRLAFDKYGYHYAIQCELIGQGIQKNNLKIEGNKILCFNVFNIDKYEYLNFEDFINFCKELEIETVSILETDYLLDDNIDNLVEKSKGFSVLNSKIYREGIVIRPLKEIIDLQMSSLFTNGRVSFKVVNPDYLLKYEE
ncbi:MAG: RNA ligase (ATP) [Nanoarchaeota archaeon]